MLGSRMKYSVFAGNSRNCSRVVSRKGDSWTAARRSRSSGESPASAWAAASSSLASPPAGSSELETAAQALAGLSPENRDLLAAVQESPYRLTTLEQFREFPANTEYFVLEPNIRKVEDVGWRYLAQHLDVLLPSELLDAIDPVSFGKYAMQEEQGCFTSRGYLTLSGDEWEHECPRERQSEKKPSIKERLEQSRKECANQSKAQPHREKSAPEL